VLIDLSFLQTGQQWPPQDEQERLNRYAANKLLFDSKHALVFREQWTRLMRDGGVSFELLFNWPKRLSMLWADLLLGETPSATSGETDSPEDQALQRIIEWNDFWNTAYEAAIDASRYGTAVFKTRFDGWGRIEVIPPSIWFPVVDPANIKDVQYHVLAWLSRIPGDPRESNRRILNVEIHSEGQIEYRYYLTQGDKGTISREIQDDERYRWRTEQTGIDEFLVRPVHNLTTSDEIYGQDDYEDIQSIVSELEVRAAQISKILDKHADPNMYGDEAALDVDPQTGEAKFRGGGRFFPVQPGGQAPGYITWDGNLDAAFKQFELLMEQFYALSETSPAAFGQLKAGLAESGSALRRLMMAPLAKVNRMRLRFDRAVKEVLILASRLEVAAGMDGAVALKDVSIAWNDGLPDDPAEETDIAVKRIEAGTLSKETAIRRLDGLEGEELEDELERIRTEQEASMPIVTPARSTGLLFGETEEEPAGGGAEGAGEGAVA